MGEDSRRARVLVVDDAQAMREIAAFTLEAMGGYDVEAVDSGPAALGRLGQGSFDILITDFSMSDMNGIDLVKAVRSLPECSRLPVIMMSFDDDAVIREAAIAAGVNAFVAKPLEPDDLRAAIRTVLPEGSEVRPTASGYMLLGVQSILDSLPHPAMLLDADHNVMLANRAFFDVTRARFNDCGLRCSDAMHDDGTPEGCPLVESAATGRRVERLVARSVVGPVEVSVYPTDISDGEGNRLYLHLTRPAISAIQLH